MDGAEFSRLWKVCTRTATFAQGMQPTAHSQEAAVVCCGGRGSTEACKQPGKYLLTHHRQTVTGKR